MNCDHLAERNKLPLGETDQIVQTKLPEEKVATDRITNVRLPEDADDGRAEVSEDFRTEEVKVLPEDIGDEHMSTHYADEGIFTKRFKVDNVLSE